MANEPATEPSTDLVLYQPAHAGPPETETVNLRVAMAGLSAHTQRAYRRWIGNYLTAVNEIGAQELDLTALNVDMAAQSLGPAPLKAWLGQLKARKLGKQSIMQAKAAVVWLAQFLADLGRIEYAVASGLSRVKAPRAETGQRSGTWLTQEEIKRLLLALRRAESNNASGAAAGSAAKLARDTAMVVLMVTCGLRRDEVAAIRWHDLARQGRNNVLRVHGKGEKLRTVKLPDMTVQAIQQWRPYHPNPTGDRPMFTRIWRGGGVTTSPITDRAVWIVVQRAAQLAGLPSVSPHDLRRSFARGAFEAGVSFELIRQALGHSSIATTERYVNSALELDRAATDIWANLLDEAEE